MRLGVREIVFVRALVFVASIVAVELRNLAVGINDRRRALELAHLDFALAVRLALVVELPRVALDTRPQPVAVVGKLDVFLGLGNLEGAFDGRVNVGPLAAPRFHVFEQDTVATGESVQVDTLVGNVEAALALAARLDTEFHVGVDSGLNPIARDHDARYAGVLVYVVFLRDNGRVFG